ncbi:transporter suffix domain-containing protein [Pseudomonas sp. MDT1-16]|uniref:transporter suffix domain-containing protein n=1 Tax=Pseudomonas sp. AL03 TaxID=3042230 RepID=UPI00249C2C33|nr:transporter suffix domain-containing protein [Pseudomonas sp. AL03]MDI3273676.1 transporter suffix domain-containing protein [Pseudomonas sp. AL03]
MNNTQGSVEPHSAGWRFKVGITIICLMLGSWLMVPAAAAAGVPGSKIAALTGVLFISNKVLLILVITIMGKSGFQQLKRSVFGYVSTLAPKADLEVGSARHRIGIVMFCLPLISSLLEPYVDSLWPGLRPNLWQLQALGDAMLIGSFFVLGGNFWEKVRALFIRTARVANTNAV